MIEVAPYTLVLYADIGCPWSHVATHRLHRARRKAGLDNDLAFDIRSFPLELFNERPTPKHILDAEIPVTAELEPDAGWSLWKDHESKWPVTMLPAMEAVYAAKEQGLELGAGLDRALRLAFFRDSRCVSMHHEILAAARDVDHLDASAIDRALISGTFRHRIFDDQQIAKDNSVKGSPQVFLPDGTDAHNPGIETHWEKERGGIGAPVIDRDDPSVYDRLVTRAMEWSNEQRS
ncbi:MAG: DsbA family oxidoreductase [Actinomycetota bacterium]